MTETVYIVHDDPVRKSACDYIGMIDLGPFDLPGQQEQVWLKSLGNSQYEMCCIPFVAYGIALGDTVRLGDDGFVSGILRRSGRRVLRFLLAKESERDFSVVVDVLREERLQFEGRGGRQVAVDLPDSELPLQLTKVMGQYVDAGRAFWEWNDVIPFSVATEK